jgi:folate-binding protein YgfZ
MTPSPLLSHPGAVAADEPDQLIAGHYGDPLREQRQLTESVALVDRSNRGVITVTGADRLTWLNDLTSQSLSSLTPMTGAEALVLTAQGHVEHHLVVTDDGETTWLDVEPTTAEALRSYLDSMRFMLRVEAADVTPEWAVLSLIGPMAPQAMSRAFDVVVPDEPYAAVALPVGGFARRMPWPSDVAYDLVVPRHAVESVAASLEVPLAGIQAFEALRVLSGRPLSGMETDHRTLPHEVGWIGTAVRLNKGCYRGQETVAHVHNLGRPPRRLVRLHLDGMQEELPVRGAEVHGAEKVVGKVTTVARHYEEGPLALALISYKTPDDSKVQVGDGDAAMMASIESIVSIDEGPRPGAAARAQFRRLR